MEEVFMPMNVRMEEAILANCDLIDEAEMPPAFVALCAHVEGYKVVLKKWKVGDYSENTSSINYPDEVQKYVEGKYGNLKTEQARLIALTTRKAPKKHIVLDA